MAVSAIDYLTRWRDALAEWTVPAPEDDDGTADRWERLAEVFRKLNRDFRPESDPLITRLLPLLNRDVTVLEVGVGAGRFTVPIARHARAVIAVEPSPAMRKLLAEELEQHGLTNVEIVPGFWPDVAVPTVDLAVCANVLYDVSEAGPFLLQFDAIARQACFVYLTRNHPLSAMRDLWEAFRHWTPPLHPTYLDAAGCLHQLGIYCNVERARSRPLTYADPQAAVSDVRRRLGLSSDPARDAALHKRLVARGHWEDGRWLPHYMTQEMAILSWRKAHQDLNSSRADPAELPPHDI